MIRVFALMLLLTSLTVSVPLVAHAQSRSRIGPDEQPFALTISGGVSLGAYEAGLNWTILKALRLEQESGRNPTPALVGVTGASAGAINALISALTWCMEDDGLGTFENNLFRRTWLAIDFKNLLPMDGRRYDRRGAWSAAGTRQDDGLLTRSAFDELIKTVMDLMRNGKFRTGCSITLGLTVTRPNPEPMTLKGLHVTQQRVVLPLELSIQEGRPVFRPMIGTDRGDLYGNTLYLASRDKTGVVAHEDVIAAVLASSAFPMAFSAVPLTECVPVAAREKACPYGRPNPARDCTFVTRRLREPALACEDDFMDGGVFDNVPLGVAVAQIESSERVRSAARPVRYIYMEPDNRRGAQEKADDEERHPLGTVKANLDFALGALATARNYELHNVLRYNAWNEHTDELGFKAARLLGELANISHKADEGAALGALRGLIDSRREAAGTIEGCTAADRPLAKDFSWEPSALRPAVEIILNAMPCADALLAAAPQNATLRRTYIEVASRSLAVIAASLRRARLSRGSFEAAHFQRYRGVLLERLMGNDTGGAPRIEGLDGLVASAAPVASGSDEVGAVLDKIGAAAASKTQDPALNALVRDAMTVMAELEALVGDGYLLAAVAAKVATRHRCAATLLASARQLEELAARPRDEDARETRDRVEQVRSAVLAVVAAAECPAATSRALDTSSQPTNDRARVALLGAADIVARFHRVVELDDTWHKALSAIESLSLNVLAVGHIERARGLADQARRKGASVHEDRALMLSTRYAPLASSYLSAFSGFLDEPLRHYDYLVGVYDGLHGLAEYLCEPDAAPGSSNLEPPPVACIVEKIEEIADALAVDHGIVNTLARLEHAPKGVAADPMPGNHDNVERVMNALFDPRRCIKAKDKIVDGRCMTDEDFGAFVTELKRRGYRTDSPYMQRALRNPGAWWVTPGMYALRRMQAIEATKGDKNWRRGSVIAQRLYRSLEDRLETGLTVPSVLPPRFGWGMPWFRLSMTMDWTFSGEGRYRLRPIGYATTGCPLGVCGLALYGNVGLRVDDGATGEAGLTLAWRNTEIAPVLYGVELAGYADLSRSWRPRYEAAVIVSTHVRGGVGYAQDDSAFYAFLGIDDPIGMISSFRGLLPPWP